jgi:hypothetical protein
MSIKKLQMNHNRRFVFTVCCQTLIASTSSSPNKIIVRLDVGKTEYLRRVGKSYSNAKIKTNGL